MGPAVLEAEVHVHTRHPHPLDPRPDVPPSLRDGLHLTRLECAYCSHQFSRGCQLTRSVPAAWGFAPFRPRGDLTARGFSLDFLGGRPLPRRQAALPPAELAARAGRGSGGGGQKVERRVQWSSSGAPKVSGGPGPTDLIGVPRSQEIAPPLDPAVGLCVGTYGAPGGGAFSYERGTPENPEP